jgi:hypothetical protein
VEYINLNIILTQDFIISIYSPESASGYGGKGQNTVELGRQLGYNMSQSVHEENLRESCHRESIKNLFLSDAVGRKLPLLS